MSLEKIGFRPSFQAKILIPVIALLILLPALTLGIVYRSSLEALSNQSRHALETADSLFQNSLNLRSRQLIARYKNVVSDPRFRAVSKLSDAPTMREHLHERLESEELGEEAEIVIFLNDQGQSLASAQREARMNAAQFAAETAEVTHQALEGQAAAAVVPLGASIFNAVAVPVLIDQKLTGVLIVGVRLGVNILRELTNVIGGEGALLSNGEIAACTLRSQLRPDSFPHWSSANSTVTESILIDRTHYLAMASRFPGTANHSEAGYVLFISYEKELQHLRHTQATLWLLCLIGIAISTAVILWMIRKITAPLRELRLNAEAVGSGDFSRKLAVRSSDEFGQLTHAFNQMTRSLRASHHELQSTVETLKATQAQLIQSEKLSAVGEFVSGIAHELNNPLTAVIGFAEMLRQGDIPSKYHQYLNYIVRSSERCHKIVHGLLSFARQHPPERKVVKLHMMIDAVVELLAYEMRTSNIAVERNYQDSLPDIMGDSHQLQQVVLNLLNNARQAMEAHQPSGRIQITTHASGDKVRILVEDNGPGISQENLAKIFNPFFTTKPVGKGTGLGLSLCYGIIREHGGTISAQSAPGKGATFMIELPVYKASGIDGENAASITGSTLNGAGKRALVIDDEEWILELVRQILHKDGFEVDIASDGSVALDQVQRSRYELLVCDWKMPGLSGPQLFDRISEISPEAANRVIFMTGDVVSDSVQNFLKKHQKLCLAKPFSVDEFRQTIGDFIARN